MVAGLLQECDQAIGPDQVQRAHADEDRLFRPARVVEDGAQLDGPALISILEERVIESDEFGILLGPLRGDCGQGSLVVIRPCLDERLDVRG